MLLKYTLKNIFSKPVRLIIIICMTAACLAGFMAADLGNTFTSLLTDVLTRGAGKANYLIMYQGTGGVTPELLADMPPTMIVSTKSVTKREIRRDEKQYTYAITDTATIYSFNNLDIAHEMKLIPDDVVPEDGEIAISTEYSEKYGYKDGDIITLTDKEDNEHSFTVKGTFTPCTLLNKYSGVISKGSYITLRGDSPYYSAFVDVLDDDQCREFKDIMREKHPNVTVILENFITEDDAKWLNNVAGVLYLAFVLVFILVIFVTVSFTEKIITERMSVIGTLRSIGMSMRKTTAILLFENVLYGLVGSINGFILYIFVRKFAVDMYFSWVPDEWRYSNLNPWIFPVVLLGAVLIQVIVPLKEVLKAVKTSIRDIIFETRDSEYKLSHKKTAAGAVCVAAGLILGYSFSDLRFLATAILLVIIGSALMIQFIVRKITLLFAKLFDKWNMPVAELAAAETGSKKPNSGNAVLTVSAVSAAAAVFVIINSILFAINKPIYDTDIIVTNTSLKTSKYEYVEETDGVTAAEYIYMSSDKIRFGDDEKQYVASVMALPSTGQYLAMGTLPSELGKDEVVIDPPTATKMNVSEGDSIDITFHCNGIFPFRKTMTVKKITEESQIGISSMIIISPEFYKELFSDTVSSILIRTSDPASVKAELEFTFTNEEEVQTMEESIEEAKDQNGKFIAAMTAVMAASVALTLIGISGNQLIGFAARKKEYAMLHSCACPRSKIIRLILIENALLFGISCIAAGLVCIPVSIFISKVFLILDLGLNATVRYNMLMICIFVLWLITMLTAMSPIKSLKKMNTAMELKYE